jgi:predicted metal-dependent HD superfamily phosphohydrolase
MSRTDLSHWSALWDNLHCAGDPVPCHRELVAAYAEKHRHYHNLQHLEECLTEFDAVRSEAKQPALVEMALWFHDAVYDPHSNVNEETSAHRATKCLTAANVRGPSIESVHQLIMCTKTHESPPATDGALLIDVDLAILGQPSERFWAYERGIKAEYAWVPAATYILKRNEILAGFLNRPAIYRTEHLRRKYESVARTNLSAAIERLRTSLREAE